MLVAGPAPVAASCPVCAGVCCASAIAPTGADAESVEEGAGVGSGLAFELETDATLVPTSPPLRALAAWRSARLEGFDLTGCDSSAD